MLDEKILKETLAQSYYLLAKFGLDDQTYTHLSARLPNTDCYFVYPLGLLFSECTPSNLIKVKLLSSKINSQDDINLTGYIMHSAIYTARPDINAIFHLHTTAGVAVSAMQKGLIPISQFSMHFFNRISYYDYNSLTKDPNVHGEQIVSALQNNKAMFLRNHGTITCGSSIEEAFFYTMFLEKACKVQVAAINSHDQLIMPDKDCCEQAAVDLLKFEKNEVGKRDFNAYCRTTQFPWEQ